MTTNVNNDDDVSDDNDWRSVISTSSATTDTEEKDQESTPPSSPVSGTDQGPGFTTKKQKKKLLTTLDSYSTLLEQEDKPDAPRAKIQRLPVRPGKPECQFFVKTGRCAFGMKCKHNHPVEKMLEIKAEEGNSEALPIRPNADVCPYFHKTSYCKFGFQCKFTHPQSIIDERNARLRRKAQRQASPPSSPLPLSPNNHGGAFPFELAPPPISPPQYYMVVPAPVEYFPYVLTDVPPEYVYVDQFGTMIQMLPV